MTWQAMVEIEQTAESWTARAEGIEVSFRNLGDRWGHFLAFRDGDMRQLLLTSCEGGPEDSLPPSPAWQELLLERPEESSCEFQLFGRVGAGIYSAAVRFDGKAQTVTFDACVSSRKPDAPVCTTCTYDIGVEKAAPRIAAQHGQRLVIEWPAVRLTLEPLEFDHQPASSCRQVGDERQHRLQVGRLSDNGGSPPQVSGSLRWGFRMQIERRAAAAPSG